LRIASVSRRTLLPIAGAALLAAFAVASLPFSSGLFRAPRTPYDRGAADFTVPAWILLLRAEPLVPRGSSVLVRAEPPDVWTDTYLHRFAVALLPGRAIRAAALWGVPTERGDREAEYTIVVGRLPSPPPGRLLLEIREGTVWRSKR